MLVAQVMEQDNRAPEEILSLQAQHDRLLTLVGELLEANQQLRFKVAQLERQAESAERGLAAATAWAPLLLP
jgi:hypothetical protein